VGNAAAILLSADYEGDRGSCSWGFVLDRMLKATTDPHKILQIKKMLKFKNKYVQTPPFWHISQKLLKGPHEHIYDLQYGLGGHFLSMSGETTKFGKYKFSKKTDLLLTVREQLQLLTVAVLKEKMDAANIKILTKYKKADLIGKLVEFGMESEVCDDDMDEGKEEEEEGNDSNGEDSDDDEPNLGDDTYTPGPLPSAVNAWKGSRAVELQLLLKAGLDTVASDDERIKTLRSLVKKLTTDPVACSDYTVARTMLKEGVAALRDVALNLSSNAKVKLDRAFVVMADMMPKKQKGLKGRESISQGRLLFRCTLRYMSWLKTRPLALELVEEKYPRSPNEIDRDYLERVCEDNQPLCCYFRYFEVDLDLAIGVRRRILGPEGDIGGFLTRLPQIASVLCYYNHFKIASTILTSIDQMRHLADNQRPFFDYYCEQAAGAGSDEVQEFQNSEYDEITEDKGALTDEYLINQSCLQAYFGATRRELSGFQNVGETKKKDCEIERVLDMANKPKYAGSIVQLQLENLDLLRDILSDDESIRHLRCPDKEAIGMRMKNGVQRLIFHTENLLSKPEKPVLKTVDDFETASNLILAWFDEEWKTDGGDVGAAASEEKEQVNKQRPLPGNKHRRLPDTIDCYDNLQELRMEREIGNSTRIEAELQKKELELKQAREAKQSRRQSELEQLEARRKEIREAQASSSTTTSSGRVSMIAANRL